MFRPRTALGQFRPFGAPPVNVWVTLDRGHWADTPALLGSAKNRLAAHQAFGAAEAKICRP
jgi:hypothetical protein